MAIFRMGSPQRSLVTGHMSVRPITGHDRYHRGNLLLSAWSLKASYLSTPSEVSLASHLSSFLLILLSFLLPGPVEPGAPTLVLLSNSTASQRAFKRLLPPNIRSNNYDFQVFDHLRFRRLSWARFRRSFGRQASGREGPLQWCVCRHE